MFKKKQKKEEKKGKDDFDVRTENLLSNRKVKTIINFENNECNSIKLLIVKGNTTIDVSSRFIKGKMLMFAKLSIKSFVYDMIDVFCFPNKEIRRIYGCYEIEKCFLYQNLTDTDSTSLLFTFICKFESSIPESKARDVIFECMKKSKILNRFDLSHEFWKKHDVYDYSTKKQMGLFEIENIKNQNICTIAINPKEYFEKFKNRNINKKHKGVRRDTPGMNVENYAAHIKNLKDDLNFDGGKKEEKIIQKRLQVKNTNMTMTSVNKVKFASLNDKRYYFSDGIVSLPFSHPSLNTVREYKKSFSKIHTVIAKEKNEILKLESVAVNNNDRLRILKSISSQAISYFTFKTNQCFLDTTKKFDYTATRQYILNSQWL